MQAGDLDRRITIERYDTAPDAFNEGTKVWSPIVTVWASKKDVSDSERVAAQEVGAEISTRFQIRYSTQVKDVDPRDRLICEGRVYSISAVKEIGRRDGLELSAVARAERVE